MGLKVGSVVGPGVGSSVGSFVGGNVGPVVGFIDDGSMVGVVGTAVGIVGAAVGFPVGSWVGLEVGSGQMYCDISIGSLNQSYEQKNLDPVQCAGICNLFLSV